MYHHLRHNGRTFYNAGVRCQISCQDSQSAGLAVRIVDRADDFRISVYAVFDILAYGLSGNGHAVGVQQTKFI